MFKKKKTTRVNIFIDVKGKKVPFGEYSKNMSRIEKFMLLKLNDIFVKQITKINHYIYTEIDLVLEKNEDGILQIKSVNMID